MHHAERTNCKSHNIEQLYGQPADKSRYGNQAYDESLSERTRNQYRLSFGAINPDASQESEEKYWQMPRRIEESHFLCANLKRYHGNKGESKVGNRSTKIRNGISAPKLGEVRIGARQPKETALRCSTHSKHSLYGSRPVGSYGRYLTAGNPNRDKARSE